MATMNRPTGATFADLAALGDHAYAEIIHGSIVQKASPTMEHGRSQLAFGGALRLRFDRGPGGRWPGGWWLGSEVDVEYETHELYRHDVVGWRRDRMRDCPRGRPVRIRPDWVCELLSPSNEKRDRVDKLQVLHRVGVPHYWIANPEARTLEVYRWAGDGYQRVASASAGDVIHAEPFEAVALRVDVLFGDADDDD